MKVKVVSPGNDPIVITTNAENWGELKRDMVAAGINVANMEGVERETKVSYNEDSAQIRLNYPSGQDHWILFLRQTKKIDSGSHELLESLKEEIYLKLKKEFEQRINKLESKVEVIEEELEIEDFDEEASEDDELRAELEDLS